MTTIGHSEKTNINLGNLYFDSCCKKITDFIFKIIFNTIDHIKQIYDPIIAQKYAGSLCLLLWYNCPLLMFQPYFVVVKMYILCLNFILKVVGFVFLLLSLYLHAFFTLC